MCWKRFSPCASFFWRNFVQDRLLWKKWKGNLNRSNENLSKWTPMKREPTFKAKKAHSVNKPAQKELQHTGPSITKTFLGQKPLILLETCDHLLRLDVCFIKFRHLAVKSNWGLKSEGSGHLEQRLESDTKTVVMSPKTHAPPNHLNKFQLREFIHCTTKIKTYFAQTRIPYFGTFKYLISISQM